MFSSSNAQPVAQDISDEALFYYALTVYVRIADYIYTTITCDSTAYKVQASLALYRLLLFPSSILSIYFSKTCPVFSLVPKIAKFFAGSQGNQYLRWFPRQPWEPAVYYIIASEPSFWYRNPLSSADGRSILRWGPVFHSCRYRSRQYYVLLPV